MWYGYAFEAIYIVLGTVLTATVLGYWSIIDERLSKRADRPWRPPWRRRYHLHRLIERDCRRCPLAQMPRRHWPLAIAAAKRS
jgi:hypothetical protein